MGQHETAWNKYGLNKTNMDQRETNMGQQETWKPTANLNMSYTKNIIKTQQRNYC